MSLRIYQRIDYAENTYLLCKGNDHCTSDLSCFAYFTISNSFTCLDESKPVIQEVSHMVILPLTWYVSILWIMAEYRN